MKITLGVAQKQELAITQQVVQKLDILQMNRQELAVYLQQEAMENPTIDLDELQTAPLIDRLNWLRRDNEVNYKREQLDIADDADLPPESRYSRSPTIREYLQIQLAGCHLSEKERLIAEYLIGCVDSRGYLDEEPEETAEILHAELDEVRHVLAVLRSFSPTGICSKDLRECLLKQLPDNLENQLVRLLVRKHLFDIAHGYFSMLSQSLGVSIKDLREAAQKIRTLNPIPASGFAGEVQTYYIEPDVVILPGENGLELNLFNSFQPHLLVNSTYLKMYEQTQDEAVREYLDGKLRATEFLIQCVRQREQTMESCMRALMMLQNEYFTGKRSTPKPLTQQELARYLEMHPSTVTRAIRGKYLQSIHGLIPIQQLFSIHIGDEGDYSPEEARKIIRELIQNEDKRHPLSDQRLVELLKGKGLELSRRTVAKYREGMNIPSTYARKEA